MHTHHARRQIRVVSLRRRFVVVALVPCIGRRKHWRGGMQIHALRAACMNEPVTRSGCDRRAHEPLCFTEPTSAGSSINPSNPNLLSHVCRSRKSHSALPILSFVCLGWRDGGMGKGRGSATSSLTPRLPTQPNPLLCQVLPRCEAFLWCTREIQDTEPDLFCKTDRSH